jgi:hypothetical protein
MTRLQKVFITQGARHDLEAQHYETGVEIGGAVFGFCDGGELVVDAFGGRTFDGTGSSCRLDIDYIDSMTQKYRGQDAAISSVRGTFTPTLDLNGCSRQTRIWPRGAHGRPQQTAPSPV